MGPFLLFFFFFYYFFYWQLLLLFYDSVGFFFTWVSVAKGGGGQKSIKFELLQIQDQYMRSGLLLFWVFFPRRQKDDGIGYQHIKYYVNLCKAFTMLFFLFS